MDPCHRLQWGHEPKETGNEHNEASAGAGHSGREPPPLPGAGGGGYLYMVAKDPEAAARIKRILDENRLHANARFVEMTLSQKGLQVSRS